LKRYLFDILAIISIACIAALAAGRPVVELDRRPSVIDKKQPADAKKLKKKNVQKEIVRDISSSDELKERNIFAADGKYPVLTPAGSTGGLSTGNPNAKTDTYTLIGILEGEETRAVFRESTGSIVALTVGKKLKDGSVVIRIDKFSVEIMKGKEKKELRIFDVKAPPLRRPSP
jgi:hypothetical protein